MTTDSAEDFTAWLYSHGFFIARNNQDHHGGLHYPHEVSDPAAVLAAFLGGTAPTAAALVTVEPGPERRPTGGLGAVRWIAPAEDGP